MKIFSAFCKAFIPRNLSKGILGIFISFLFQNNLSAENGPLENCRKSDASENCSEGTSLVSGCTNVTIDKFVTYMDYCSGKMCAVVTMSAYGMHGTENWHFDFGNGKSFDTTTNLSTQGQGVSLTLKVCNMYTPGTYTVTLTVSPAHNVCNAQQVVTLTKPTYAYSVPCTGASTCIDFTPPDPSQGPYTYSWVGPNGFTSTAQKPCGVKAGSYTLTVTTSKGCKFTEVIPVTEPLPLAINISNLNCTNKTATVNASGGTPIPSGNPYSQNFSSDPVNYTLTTNKDYTGAGDIKIVNGEVQGTEGSHDITITSCLNIMGCPNPTTLSLDLRKLANISTSAVILSVYYTIDGGTETLLFSVNASDPNLTTAFKNYSGTLPAGKCLKIRIRIDTGSGISSGGGWGVAVDNIKVTCSRTQSYFYTWCNGQTTPNVTNLPSPGTCTVTVTDVNGCSATTSVSCFACTTSVAVNSPAYSAGGSATLTATGTGINTYSWSTGATTPSITVNPVVTTSYTVTVVGTPSSCSATAVATVTVNPNPTITATPSTICAGSCTSLTANGAGAGGTYTWIPNIGSGAGPHNVCPSSTTTYTVTGATAAGCTGSTTVVVTVNPNPVLTAIPATICIGDNATVTANGATTYTWNTGAQGPSLTVSPTVTTTYTVTGTTNGCTGSTTVVVTINNTISIPVPPATICVGASATLTAGGSAVSYTWSIGANTQSITVTPSVTTTYTVSGTSAAGCTGTGSVVVTVNPLPTVTATPQTICAGNCTSILAGGAGPGGTYTWIPTIGNGPGSHQVCPTVTSTYTVLASSSAGCTGSTTVVVTVNPNPTITVPPATICVGDNATLTANGAVNYTWSTGATTASITVSPPATTTYTVVGRDANGCTGAASVIVTINNNISVKATPDTICVGLSSTLTASGPAVSYTWSTGATTASITVTPSITTTYTVSGTSASGCTGATTVTVVVTPIPVPNFTSAPVCLGLQTCFTNQSTISAPGTIVSYTWTFGDGGASNLQNPCRTYAAAGTYNVSLSVTSNGHCSATYTSTAVVNPLPVAAYTVTPVCLNQQSCFTDQSTTSAGAITNWTWTFGDGSPPSNQQNPCHIYPNPGTYSVTLSIVNSFGCTSTVTATTVVNPLPVANFLANNVCQGLTTLFTDASSVNPSPPNTITQWLWNFGDNATSTQQHPTHTYAEACTYTVTLTATTNNGCISNTQKTVEVYPNPVASFSTTPVCLGSVTQFTDMSTLAQAGPNCTSPPAASTLAWKWNFGDPGSGTNNTSTLQHPTHLYSTMGNYVITLTVTTNHGCASTYSTTVTVYPPPTPLFTANRVCLGMPSLFTDGSIVSAGGGTVASWTWNFGDPASGANNTSNTQNPTHIFTAPRTFTVTLSVTTSFGCIATYTATATVDPIPVADFTFTEPCLGIATQFTDKSSIPAPGGIITSWGWSFGDGGTSTQQNPAHTYAAAGSYTVILIVTTTGGCKDTVQKPVNVWPIPVPYFGPPAKGCRPVCVNFRDSSSIVAPSTITGWSWNFGDPASGAGNISSAQHPVHCYNAPGLYSVTMTATSDKGCKATLGRNNIIEVYPFPTADFSASPQPATLFLDDVKISFTDHSTGGPVKWNWVFERGGECDTSTLTSTLQNPTHTYCDTGTYQVCLKIENKYTCPDSICKYIIIGPEWTFFIPNAFSPNGDGKNEGFKGKSWNVIEHEMWIFDRWGNMIYYTGKTKDPETAKAWDGRANDGVEPAQEDVYVWVVILKDIFGKRHKYIGHVTLVK